MINDFCTKNANNLFQLIFMKRAAGGWAVGSAHERSYARGDLV